MIKLYLVRHGETVGNRARIIQGQTHGELNDAGRDQARGLCERMRGERICAFVSSDLFRAQQTCGIIARPHGKCVVATPLLRERDWGSLTGKFVADLQEMEWPDDVEPLEKMLSRAQNFLTWLKVTFPNQTVLAVGHGIINKAIQSVYFKKPMDEIHKMENGEVRVLML